MKGGSIGPIVAFRGFDVKLILGAHFLLLFIASFTLHSFQEMVELMQQHSPVPQLIGYAKIALWLQWATMGVLGGVIMLTLVRVGRQTWWRRKK